MARHLLLRCLSRVVRIHIRVILELRRTDSHLANSMVWLNNPNDEKHSKVPESPSYLWATLNVSLIQSNGLEHRFSYNKITAKPKKKCATCWRWIFYPAWAIINCSLFEQVNCSSQALLSDKTYCSLRYQKTLFWFLLPNTTNEYSCPSWNNKLMLPTNSISIFN